MREVERGGPDGRSTQVREGRRQGALQGQPAGAAKLTEVVDGELRIRSEPPLLVPGEELVAAGDRPRPRASCCTACSPPTATACRPTASTCSTATRSRHIARKVVGVGSVGTRAWVILLTGADDGDPLFLQAKEAEASVLEPYAGASEFENHGQRVVEGQRLMQAASDIFLGWCPAIGLDGRERDFYVRQLWDWKRSAEVERHDPARARALRAALRLDPGPRPRPLRRPRSRSPPTSAAATPSTRRSPSSPSATPTRTSATTRPWSRRSTPAASPPRRSERGAQSRGRRRRPDPDDALRRAVPDDARQLGDERLDRHRRQGRRHHRHRDPDRDHPLHAGDGLVHDHRRQDRPDHRPQARLRDRLRDLRLRLDDHGAGAEPAGAADRLVVPGGARRRADPARDRRPRRRQLRPRRAAAGLRPGHRGGGGRGRGRADHRRLLHHLPLLALRLRRRGPDRARDPRPRPPHRGRRAGEQGAAGPGRDRALGRSAWA